MSTTAYRIAPTPLADRYARAGLWLLPVYATLLALSTLTHQPDPGSDFAGYARYVTTDIFLVSHLVASILGAALGLVGAVAALAFLVRGPAVTAAVVGTALTIAGSVLSASVFGAAAFAQPAIGNAYLDGAAGMPAFNDSVYGAPLFTTAGVGLLLFMAGAIAVGWAISHTGGGLRWAGVGYAVFLPLFVVSGFLYSTAQPVAAAALAVVSVVIAARLPKATA